PAWSDPNNSVKSNLLAIDKYFLYYQRRRQGIYVQFGDVDHSGASRGWEPQPPVSRPNSRGLPSSVAFGVRQPIFFSISNTRDRFDLALGEVLELLFAHAVNPPIAAHPEVASQVVEHLKDSAVEQSVAGPIVREAPVTVP